jgi:hypothetical protein
MHLSTTFFKVAVAATWRCGRQLFPCRSPRSSQRRYRRVILRSRDAARTDAHSGIGVEAPTLSGKGGRVAIIEMPTLHVDLGFGRRDQRGRYQRCRYRYRAGDFQHAGVLLGLSRRNERGRCRFRRSHTAELERASDGDQHEPVT